jgi:putative ATPase
LINKVPLAEALRPKNFDDYLGQEHLAGPDGLIRRMLEKGVIPSMIFWGPPGTGKTTLALLIAEMYSMDFYKLSAVNAGVKDVRSVIDSAMARGGGILFIDEIHRFSKSQQDSLLGAVEKGTVTLIGATTENPSFEVIPPLLSRSQVYVLHHLEDEHLKKLLDKAISYIADNYKIQVDVRETDGILAYSGGDARKLLNTLDLIVLSMQENDCVVLTNDVVKEVARKKTGAYDKAGEYHYDIISAFIKSLRGSDPNGALYWMARMLNGGEDPLFIARRMLILASEDIGNANPTAMILANACFEAVHKVGMPEARIILSQTAVYLASSQKSNASYLAIEKASEIVRKTGDLPVPLHLRNAPTKLMKDLDYGLGYKYAHDFPGSFVEQEFLPDQIRGTRLYDPGKNAREEELRQRLRNYWKEKYGY